MIWKSKGIEVNGFCFIKKKTNHKNKSQKQKQIELLTVNRLITYK